MSLADVARAAAPYGIRIMDWRGGEFVFPLGPSEKLPQTRQAWVRKLTASLSDFAMSVEDNQTTFTLLPWGISVQTLANAKALAAAVELESLWKRKDLAQKVDPRAPVVQSLRQGIAELAAKERERTLDYQRVVNPEHPTGAYTFRVHWDDRVGRLTPFEKNGEPLANAMEGFTTYNSVQTFLDKFSDRLTVSTESGWVFFSFEEDPDSMMAAKTDGANYVVSVRARPQKGPQLDYQLSGEAAGYAVYCKIFHPGGEVVLTDKVTLR